MDDNRRNGREYYEELFLAWLDGELAPDEERELERAVERGILDPKATEELFAVRSLLLEAHAPSPAAERRHAPRFSHSPFKGPAFLRTALFAAVFLVVLTALLFQGRDRATAPSDLSREARLEKGAPPPAEPDSAPGRPEASADKLSPRSKDKTAKVPRTAEKKKGQAEKREEMERDEIFESEKEGGGKALGGEKALPIASAKRGMRGARKKRSVPVRERRSADSLKRNITGGKGAGKAESGRAAGNAVPSLGRALPPPVVLSLSGGIYHYARREGGRREVVLKAGKVRAGGKEPLDVLLPHFGRLRLEGGSVVEIEVRSDGRTAGLPGLVLRDTAERCVVFLRMLKGSAHFVSEDGAGTALNAGESLVVRFGGIPEKGK